VGIFLDTGKLDEIKKYHAMGIIRGVTTNPSIMVRDGVKGGMAGVKKHSIKISKLIYPLPLSVEVTNNDPVGMKKQALDFSKWATNINLKIPIHGPHGELNNLSLIQELEAEYNIRMNVTAMMSAQQCYLAGMAGATFVSLFGGRINDMGYNAREEVRRLRKLLDQFSLGTKIIVGSCGEVVNVIEWFEAGAHIVTVPPKMVHDMIVHPYSKETVQQFIRDGARLEVSHKK
jgi:transaldolase